MNTYISKYIGNYLDHFAFIARTVVAIVVAFTGGTFAQSVDTKKADTGGAASANVQTVDARQNGPWMVGVDPSNNTVRLAYSNGNPLPVIVMNNPRVPFQSRISVAPTGNGYASANLLIPAGKRLVIENISAIARYPVGLKMELNFYTYVDNGDGMGNGAVIAFHRIALIDQGVFDGTEIASANHKVLVFADETIGGNHTWVTVQARLNGSTAGFTQGQITFSGYLEDLPVQ